MAKPNPAEPSSNSSTISGPVSRLSLSQQQELIAILTDTATVLGETISSPRITGLLAMVEHLPFERLRLVLQRWSQTHDWFPKPRQVIDAVNVQEDLDFEAEAAWQRVLDGCQEYGPETERGKYAIASSFTKADWFGLRTVGGIRRLASTDIEKSDLGFIRRDFVHAWKLFEEKQSRIGMEVSWHSKQLAAGER